MSFKTKADVDRHAEDIFRKCTSDHDRKLKSLSVGKLYLSVKAYDSAIRHFQAFLSVNENSPETYKLLGKCFQQSGKLEKAIASFKRSLELEPPQPALILLICELMNQMNLADVGISTARHWCERGNDLFPNNSVVSSLKQKIVVAEDKDPKALEKFYLTELRSNPNDENILINLLNLYVDTKQYAAAHKKVLEYQGNSTFHESLEWHRCLSKVYKFCLKETPSGGDQAEYLLEAVSVGDNYLSILHRARNDGFSDEATTALQYFDQLLWKLCSVPGLKNPIDRDIQKHYLAQLAYHMSVLLSKKLVQENASKVKALELIGPGLLFAQASPFDLESPHLSSLDSKYRAKMKYLVDDAIFRVAQANLTLRNWSSETSENQFVSNITHSYSKETRALVFSKILKSDNMESSCWLACSYFDKLPSRLLSVSEIVTESNLFSYERRSFSSYHDLVWLGVQLLLLDVSGEPRFLPQIFNCQTFPSSSASPQNLSSASIETLSKLDVDSFLYLSVFSCYFKLIEIKNTTWHRFSLADAMPLLPTEKQLKFWAAAKKSQKNELVNDSLDLKSILAKGIETVRLIGHHGLDLKLLVHVARTLENIARSAAKESDALHTSAVENRAFLYWRNVIQKLDLLQQNHDVYESSNSFFPFKSKSPIKKREVLERILEEGRFFIAYKMMRNEDYPNAIDVFKSLRRPDAALNEALIYKRLAMNEIKDHESDEITSDMRTKHNMWLMKAKQALKVAEERIGGNPNHPLCVELETQVEEIEGRLVRYDRDFGDEGGSDSLPSSISSNEDAESYSLCLPPSSYNSLSHNLDLRLKPKESIHQRSRIYPENYSLKEIIASHTRTLKIVEQLAKKVVQMEMDVGLLAKNVKKTERNLEKIVTYLRHNPIANPVFQNLPMANLMFPPHMMPNPNLYPPNIPDLRLQPMPPMVPPFLAPGMPPFLQPGLPLMPPLPLPAQAHPFGLFQTHPRPSLEVSQLNLSTSVLPQQPSPSLYKTTDPSQNYTYTVVQENKNTQSPSLTTVTQTFSKSESVPVSQSQASASYTSPSSSFSPQQPVMTPAPFFKPSTLSLPVSNAVVTAQPVITPSKQVPFSVPLSFTPNAVSTPPRGHAPFFKPGTETPGAPSTPIQTTVSTSLMTPTSNTEPVVSIPSTSQNVSRSKVSEPLFNLLTKPSSANSSSMPISTPVTAAFTLPPQTASINAAGPTLPPGSQSSTQVSTNNLSCETISNSALSTPVISKPDNTAKSLLKATLLKSVDVPASSPFNTTVDVSSSSSRVSTGSSPLISNTTLDFANLAKNSGDSSFRKSGSFKGFEGQGSKLFESSPSSTKDFDSPANKDGESAEDFIPTAEFQPLIALPDLIEVKTGEEGLSVLYEERCKLLRFDADLKEWKERGLGKMKILHDPVKGTVRLLMRREQVHKVCCNQNLSKDFTLKPVTTSDKAWTWFGPDFSEGEQVMETFALRFKNYNLAQEFFAAVENAKTMIGNKTADDTSDISVTDKLANNKNEKAPLSELFKPETGSWECTECYTRNSKEKSKCLACEAPNPNQPEAAKTPVQKPSLGPSVIQLGSNTSSFTFGIPQSASKNTADSNKSNAVMQKSSFGADKSQFGSNTPSFSFGIPQPSNEPETEKNAVNGNSKHTAADSLSKSIFSFKLSSDNNTVQKSEASDLNKTSFAFGKPAESNSTFTPQKSELGEVSKTSFLFGKPAEPNSQNTSQSEANQLPKINFSSKLAEYINAPQKAEGDEVTETSFAFGKPVEQSIQKNKNQPFSVDSKTMNGSEAPKSSFSFNFTNGTNGIFNGGSTSLSAPNSTQQAKPAASIVTTNEPAINSSSTFAFGPNSRKSLGLELGGSKNFSFSMSQQGAGDETLIGDETLLADQGSENDETLNDSDDNIHFEPIIPLPPEIVPTTGEEDETVLYCHLAKLYRYRDGEWKERGTGDIKILKHKVKGDIRFVMRRKPVDIVCLNHFVTKDIQITSKDAKSWTWTALDFSDGTDCNVSEMKPDVFSLRFKNPEIANEFKAAVDSALNSKPLNGAVSTNGKGK